MRVVPVGASTKARDEAGKPPTRFGSLDELKRWEKMEELATGMGRKEEE